MSGLESEGSADPRDDDSLVYLDGELVPVSEARVSVYDHAFLYGDGVFETVRVVEGRAFRLPEHLDRLERSAAAISLALPEPRERIAEAILRTVAANGHRMSFVKVILTRGAGSEPLLRHEGLRSTIAILVWPSMPFLDPGEEGVSAAVVGTRKTPAMSLDPRIKSLNYLNVIQSRIEARSMGADESILLDTQGRVAEGSIYNVIVSHRGRLTSPAEGCLEGITLRTIWEAALERGYAAERTSVYPYDLLNADEVMFASTAVGLIPVTTVNGSPVGCGSPGPVYADLRDAYEGALTDPARGTGVPYELYEDQLRTVVATEEAG